MLSLKKKSKDPYWTLISFFPVSRWIHRISVFLTPPLKCASLTDKITHKTKRLSFPLHIRLSNSTSKTIHSIADTQRMLSPVLKVSREFERCPPVRLAFVDLVDQLFLHIERLGQDALAESVKQSVVVANLPAHQVKRLVMKEPSINVSKGGLSGCLKIEDSERPFV
jgi:hypothetical protein